MKKSNEEKQTIENWKKLLIAAKKSEQSRKGFIDRRDHSEYPYGLDRSWDK